MRRYLKRVKRVGGPSLSSEKTRPSDFSPLLGWCHSLPTSPLGTCGPQSAKFSPCSRRPVRTFQRICRTTSFRKRSAERPVTSTISSRLQALTHHGPVGRSASSNVMGSPPQALQIGHQACRAHSLKCPWLWKFAFTC